MKTIFKSLILVCFAALIVSVFITCKKDTDCKAVITCKLQSDTNAVVPNANIEIKQDGGEVIVTGTTDGSGQFLHTYKLEAIFNVIATKDNMAGQTVIRLKPGETVNVTVLIQ